MSTAWEEEEIGRSLINLLADEVTIKFDMLCSFMIYLVGSNLNSGLVVAIKDGGKHEKKLKVGVIEEFTPLGGDSKISEEDPPF